MLVEIPAFSDGQFSKSCYEAVVARKPGVVGEFVTAVRTTGIFCRRGCSARTPLARNVVFYHSTAAAEAAGFRACKRCRPNGA